MTLIEMVQNILSEMGSDEVNSIGDTAESQQVLGILKDTYFDIVEGSNEYGFTFIYQRLEGVGDLTAPTKLKIPEGSIQVKGLKYDKRGKDDTSAQWHQVYFLTPEEFMEMMANRGDGETNIITVDIGTGVPIYCYNDQPPQYYTSFDQDYIFCDGYDSSVDATLQDSKTWAQTVIKQPWQDLNTFEPVMPYPMKRLILNEAKARCFASIKGEVNQHAAMYTRNNSERLKKGGYKTQPPVGYVRWGRP